MKKVLVFALGLSILASCSTSSDVASNKLFQKRKYQKGWNVNTPKKYDKSSEQVSEEIASAEETTVQEEVTTPVSTEQTTVSTTVAQEVTVMNEVTASYEEVAEEIAVISNTSTVEVAETIEAFVAENVTPIEAQEISAENEDSSSSSSMGAEWYLYVLAFFIPWLAVGLATDWDIQTVVINILWTMLCGIPGVIHAFIIVSREG